MKSENFICFLVLIGMMTGGAFGLPEPSVTELRIAAQVSGLGNGSCGPSTYEEYQALSAPTEYRFYLKPLACAVRAPD